LSGHDDRKEVLRAVLEVISEMSEDWEYSGPLTAETRMFADMEVVSLDFVTLASAMVNRYGPLPFDDFYTRIGEQPPESREVTVGEFADFVSESLAGRSPAGSLKRL
jgi:hypothetical protein